MLKMAIVVLVAIWFVLAEHRYICGRNRVFRAKTAPEPYFLQDVILAVFIVKIVP